MAFGILVPQSGIEPVPPEVEAWSPNYWTAREAPRVEGHLISKFNLHALYKSVKSKINTFSYEILQTLKN